VRAPETSPDRVLANNDGVVLTVTAAANREIVETTLPFPIILNTVRGE
jgi:hypothetical protein